MSEIAVRSGSQPISLSSPLQPDPRMLKVVRQINEEGIPGNAGKAAAMLRAGGDSLSFTRNVLYTIPNINHNHFVIEQMGHFAGIISSFFALRTLDGGVTEYKRSAAIGDAEGRSRSEAAASAGGVDVAASLTTVAGKVSGAAAALGVASALFGIGSLIGLGASFWGAMCCVGFHHRLTSSNDPATLRQSLQFLKDSISVTDAEKSDLEAQIAKEHPLWTSSARARELEKRLVALTEVKVKYVKRRTGHKSLFLITAKTDRLLAQLANGDGVQEACAMLSAIQKENRIKTALYTAGVIASLIGLAALAISTFFSLGIVPLILYAAAAAMYLALALYSAAGTFLTKEFAMLPLEEALVSCN